MAKIFNIEDWQELTWMNTGGTRDKKIYLNPEDRNSYYFKQSYKKGKRDYKYEFWSEIIASEIGLSLDLNILQYHIAIKDKTIGCISMSMIDTNKAELTEGGKYLQAFEPKFNPLNYTDRKKYTFSLIIETLRYFKLEMYQDKIIEIIIFDALIGNSDRHQENWAIINDNSFVSSAINQISNELINKEKRDIPKWYLQFLRKFFKSKKDIEDAKLRYFKKHYFAPIYDSGCSFGRELNDEKIIDLLSNENDFNNYIEKGQSEIHCISS